VPWPALPDAGGDGAYGRPQRWSRTTMNTKGWLFSALGAWVAAVSTLATTRHRCRRQKRTRRALGQDHIEEIRQCLLVLGVVGGHVSSPPRPALGHKGAWPNPIPRALRVRWPQKSVRRSGPLGIRDFYGRHARGQARSGRIHRSSARVRRRIGPDGGEPLPCGLRRRRVGIRQDEVIARIGGRGEGGRWWLTTPHHKKRF